MTLFMLFSTAGMKAMSEYIFMDQCHRDHSRLQAKQGECDKSVSCDMVSALSSEVTHFPLSYFSRYSYHSL